MGKAGSKFADPNVMGPHHFKLGRVIGKGSFGKVLAVIHKDTKVTYAMKLLNKKDLIDRKMVKSVISERVMLSHLDFPFLVNLQYAYQTDEDLCMIIDLMTGGDVRYHLEREKKFTEQRTAFYAATIVLTLEHLETKNIIHRDLKPDNYLLDSDGFCHLTDFNISVEVVPDKEIKNFAGTAPYMAPEVWRREPYSYPVDYWSLGITIFEMITGRLPFEGSKDKLEQAIINTEPSWSSRVSADANDLLRRLLDKNPATRIKSPEIRSHPFFKDIDWEKLLSKEMKPPFEPDRTRANVDAVHDLQEQFQPKKAKIFLTLEEHQQFAEWDWTKDGTPTRPIQDVLAEVPTKKRSKLSLSVENTDKEQQDTPAAKDEKKDP